MKTVLVIDDEEKVTWAFQEFLEGEGYRPLVAHTAEEGIALVEAERPDIVICDIRLPGMNGLDALTQIRQIHPATYVILMTAYGTPQTTIRAIQDGAYDYLRKPLDLGRLRAVLRRVEQAQALRSEIETSEEDAIPLPLTPPPIELVGESPAMQEIYKLIGMLTTNRVTVLIEGESGTGKELVARAIHTNSPARNRPFVAVNCGALTETLLDSELFGHERGAFTDAHRQTIGKIEAAEDGTLFLDEIGTTSLALQVKLLRALQEREFQRVGGTKTLPVRARIIAATNSSLEEAVERGNFREDLYYRLKVVSLNLPPLRERREDIPVLVRHFLERISHELGHPIRGVEDAVMELFEAYAWPGNVRELENAIRRAAVYARGDVILKEHLPEEIRTLRPAPHVGGTSPHARLRTSLLALAETAEPGHVYYDLQNEVERILIRAALDRMNGNQVQAAQWLGISRTTLRRRIEELHLQKTDELGP